MPNELFLMQGGPLVKRSPQTARGDVVRLLYGLRSSQLVWRFRRLPHILLRKSPSEDSLPDSVSVLYPVSPFKSSLSKLFTNDFLTLAIVPLYNGETAPKRIRGTMLVFYQLQIIIGYD